MKAQNLGALLQVLQVLDQAKNKPENKVNVTEQTNPTEGGGVLEALATFIEKMSEVEKEKIGGAKEGEKLNKFGRVEPNPTIQSEDRYRIIISHLLSVEIGLAKRVGRKSEAEIVEGYINNFSHKELASLLVLRNKA